ncbi:hypothetical protein [Sphingomonas xinjiangensis]|uniref:Uncharacterized protein n=1 Tax=Sphingomonas xinjiangensis TaxID=643568 RepID=A0A840YQ92_9SPHN|nr:hypothetical protein [Sphingomonas xinjiangensis]MBB5710941.1 hypothetical protein [Sphingomonas xinjiangensis]
MGIMSIADLDGMVRFLFKESCQIFAAGMVREMASHIRAGLPDVA